MAELSHRERPLVAGRLQRLFADKVPPGRVDTGRKKVTRYVCPVVPGQGAGPLFRRYFRLHRITALPSIQHENGADGEHLGSSSREPNAMSVNICIRISKLARRLAGTWRTSELLKVFGAEKSIRRVRACLR